MHDNSSTSELPRRCSLIDDAHLVDVVAGAFCDHRAMSLSILSIAYPLAAAGLNAVGGSEQILAQIDRGLMENGWKSHVIAPEGSSVCGQLHAIPPVEGAITPAFRLQQHSASAAMIDVVLAREAIDLIHFHGLDFDRYLIATALPCVASLHLPADWYEPHVFSARHGPWLLPVSDSQAMQCPPSSRLLAPLSNGVPDEFFDIPLRKRDGPVLMLARICPEKGIQTGIEAAHRADVDLVLAGQVFPYREHHDYFNNQIVPLLDSRRRFVGPLGLYDKLLHLQNARCVLVPSCVAETSSLVVREAAATGCPVIAFPQGHLAHSIVDGVTGFLVNTREAMANAIGQIDQIDPLECRAYARAHFSGRAMVQAYLALYRRMTRMSQRAALG